MTVLAIASLLSPAAVAQGEDTAEPRIEWSSPWERGQYEGLPDTSEDAWTAPDGTLDLQATIHDDSAIESVTIERRYEATVDGRDESDHRTLRLGPTETIDETIHLGTHGTTRLTFTVRDAAGNTYVGRVAVDVDDTTPPSADLTATPDGTGWVRVTGTVRDDTQVDEIRILSGGATKIISPQQGSIDITDNDAEIDQRIRTDADTIPVTVRDRAGNEQTVDVPVRSPSTPTPTATATARPTATPTPEPVLTPEVNRTPNATATATPTATETPSGTPAEERGGVGVIGALKLLGIVVLGGVGIVMIASQLTGGRY
jgi:hypothetical protein